jgi:tetratricopeptide (TPR) repeat protein
MVMSFISMVVALSTALGAPATTPDLYRQSYVHESRGEIYAAVNDLEEIGKLGPTNYVWSLRKGWLHYLAGQYDQAVSLYDAAIALEPKAIEPRLGVLLPLMALKRWKEAEDQAALVLSMSPGEFTATSRLAFIHYTQGRFGKAEAFYRQALVAYPANVEMRTGLAWSLLKQSKPTEARAEFERVLAFAPDQPSAKEGLALLP